MWLIEIDHVTVTWVFVELSPTYNREQIVVKESNDEVYMETVVIRPWVAWVPGQTWDTSEPKKAVKPNISMLTSELEEENSIGH